MIFSKWRCITSFWIETSIPWNINIFWMFSLKHYIGTPREKPLSLDVIMQTFRSSHPEVFLRKCVSNFIEITLRHGFSPASLLYIFRTPFSGNTSEWLLLKLCFKRATQSNDTCAMVWNEILRDLKTTKCPKWYMITTNMNVYYKYFLIIVKQLVLYRQHDSMKENLNDVTSCIEEQNNYFSIKAIEERMLRHVFKHLRCIVLRI